MKNKIRKEFEEFRVLMRNMPVLLVVMFVLAVFSMNLLANKSIDLPFDWLALDCGIIVSWFAFFAMDVATKRFGPKAATELSVLAAAVNLVMCAMFAIGGALPGVWGESFVEGHEAVINAALDGTFGGTWYVLAGSTLAFLVSSAVNNFTNHGIGRAVGRDGFGAYALRSYLSTALGQFVDNLTFALVVSHVFFGWTLVQCVTCAATGMLAELAAEAIFSPLGYRLCRRWERDGVGAEYLEFVR